MFAFFNRPYGVSWIQKQVQELHNSQPLNRKDRSSVYCRDQSGEEKLEPAKPYGNEIQIHQLCRTSFPWRSCLCRAAVVCLARRGRFTPALSAWCVRQPDCDESGVGFAALWRRTEATGMARLSS